MRRKTCQVLNGFHLKLIAACTMFIDHMGPAVFAPGHGIDVRPHPHIGLATVTVLWSGAIGHRAKIHVGPMVGAERDYCPWARRP